MNKSQSAPITAEFVSLLTNHQADLWAFITSQLPGSPDISDVLQKTNLTIWNKRNDFQLGSNFRAWSMTIARYEVLAHLKSSKRSNWLVFNDQLLETFANEAPEAIPQSAIRLTHLEYCIQKLLPNHQALLNHHYHSKEGLESYAQKTGSSVSSLSVTLHRIRASLRKCINDGIKQFTKAGGQA